MQLNLLRAHLLGLAESAHIALVDLVDSPEDVHGAVLQLATLHEVALAPHELALAEAYAVYLLWHGELHHGLALHEIHLAVVGVVVHQAGVHRARIELYDTLGEMVEQEYALTLGHHGEH